MRELHQYELDTFDGDVAGAVVDLAFRSSDGPLDADECHQYARLAVDALREAGLLAA